MKRRTNSKTSGGRSHGKRPAIPEIVQGILEGDRIVLAKAITMVESTRKDDRASALGILERLLPHSGKGIRIGVTGIPGVGKSSFIERLTQTILPEGRTVAVLAIDPTSAISKGSILGDKTRMENIAKERNVFIRPSPSTGILGGVGRNTREAVVLCEAAGFDVVIVETVGVGQSEAVVHSLVDIFLLMLMPGTGDHLQGLKRGITELADLVLIHKADGENLHAAEIMRREYALAFHTMLPSENSRNPDVLACSSLTGMGMETVWHTVLDYIDREKAAGRFTEKRRYQNRQWLFHHIDQGLHERFRADPIIAEKLEVFERRVTDGEIPALTAAAALLDSFFRSDASSSKHASS